MESTSAASIGDGKSSVQSKQSVPTPGKVESFFAPNTPCKGPGLKIQYEDDEVESEESRQRKIAMADEILDTRQNRYYRMNQHQFMNETIAVEDPAEIKERLMKLVSKG